MSIIKYCNSKHQKNKKWRKLNNVPALSISLMIVFSTSSVSTKNTNIA